MLRLLDIKEVYDSEEDNILQDFYIPALSNAVIYNRAVGYFDAKVLTTAARGLASFISNGGYMRLIVGATLSDDEYEAIALGYDTRKTLENISESLQNSIASYDGELFRNQLNTLTWFIVNNKLDIRIALRRRGIYHEKIGIIEDKNGDKLVFQGSANETNNALSPYNFESINVFKSWIPAFQGHILPHLNKFETLWNDKANNTKVLDFTDITRGILKRHISDIKPPNINDEIALWQEFVNNDFSTTKFSSVPQIPSEINGAKFVLKAHQKSALIEWQNNDYRGLFELATGAGKTITALYGAVKVFESRKRLVFVVSVPYQSLADQWAENFKTFNIKPIVCYGGESKWLKAVTSQLTAFKAHLIDFVGIIVVDATLSSKSHRFIDLLNELGHENSNYILFVGDECHHHGAEANSLSLPEIANLRIGLSATPNRGEADEIGNKNIEEYYGGVVATYTLSDALADGVLTPYEYHLVEVSLTDEECESYIALTKSISKLIAMSKGNVESIADNNSLNILLNKRARIINGTINKPIALRNILNNMQPKQHSLFYCAEGSYDNPENNQDDDTKQIQVISSLLNEMGWKTSRFTANEDKLQREAILENFKSGNIHSLVAMKCLDEGIDVPACDTAFILASSRNPRQFIQRRGRILRRSFGKEKAVIYDFFVTLPVNEVDDGGIERRLLIAEVKRINEFANLAINKGESYKVLEPFLKKHDLIHYLT